MSTMEKIDLKMICDIVGFMVSKVFQTQPNPAPDSVKIQ